MPPKEFDPVYEGGRTEGSSDIGDGSLGRHLSKNGKPKGGAVYSMGDSMRTIHSGGSASVASAASSAVASIASEGSMSTHMAGNLTAKVFVLLLRPQDKIFELVQVAVPRGGTLKDLLDLVPGCATESKLGEQRHVGLCRGGDGAELLDLDLPATDDVLFDRSNPAPSVSSSGRRESGGRRGEILVAIPEGYTSSKCRQLSDKILKNPKMIRLLKRRDPLSPKVKSNRSRSRSPNSKNSSSSSSSSSAPRERPKRSSPGPQRRQRHVSSLPTVGEEEAGAGNTDTEGGSTGGGEGSDDIEQDLQTIATLLSRDSQAERRRRDEEDRVRREAEDRVRKEEERKREEEEAARAKEEGERRAAEEEAAGPLHAPPSPKGGRGEEVRRSPSNADIQIDQQDEVSDMGAPETEGPKAKATPQTSGFQMFVFGMVSSTWLVFFTTWVTGYNNPANVAPVVEEEPFVQPQTDGFFLLQFAAAFFLLNKAQKKLRRMQRTARAHKGIMGDMKRSPSMGSMQMSPAGRRSSATSANSKLSAASRSAQRMDYGYVYNQARMGM